MHSFFKEDRIIITLVTLSCAMHLTYTFYSSIVNITQHAVLIKLDSCSTNHFVIRSQKPKSKLKCKQKLWDFPKRKIPIEIQFHFISFHSILVFLRTFSLNLKWWNERLTSLYVGYNKMTNLLNLLLIEWNLIYLSTETLWLLALQSVRSLQNVY